MSQAVHESLDAVKARRLEAMSDAERAEFDEVYAAERRKLDSDEPPHGDLS